MITMVSELARPMTRLSSAALVALACLLAGPVAARQTPPVQTFAPPAAPPQEATSQLEDVLVTGQTLEALAREFVSSASAPPNYRGLARWHRELCLGVVGLRAEIAHAIIDRVSEIAEGLDIPLGEPGCSPNAIIVGTSDGQRMANDLVGERRRAFRIGFTRSNRGSRALETFRTSEAPVRWWTISFPYDSSGALCIQVFGGPPPVGCDSFDRSRTGQTIVDHLSRAIVILDIPKLSGTNLTVLSDYLAMVVLAQIDPEGDTSRFETVLNAFDGRDPGEGLTDWDRAYLDALYGAGPYRLNGPAQADALAEILASRRETASGD